MRAGREKGAILQESNAVCLEHTGGLKIFPAPQLAPPPSPPPLPTGGSSVLQAAFGSETAGAMSWGQPFLPAHVHSAMPLTSCAAWSSETVEAGSELFACLPTDLVPVEGEREGRAHNQTLISHVFGLLAHSFPSLVPPSGLFPLMGPPLPPPKL